MEADRKFLKTGKKNTVCLIGKETVGDGMQPITHEGIKNILKGD